MGLSLFGKFVDDFKCNIISGSDDIDVPGMVEDDEEFAKRCYDIAKETRREFYKFFHCIANSEADPDKYPTDLELSRMEKAGYTMDPGMDMFVDYVKNHMENYSEDADPDRLSYFIRTNVCIPMQDGTIETKSMEKGWFSVNEDDE